uniref:Uncharacterized protein n=1 Tax=Anguilla anguilla TaxID=7936 RepID=A0A0E9X262_ANGAN
MLLKGHTRPVETAASVFIQLRGNGGNCALKSSVQGPFWLKMFCSGVVHLVLPLICVL